MRNQKKPIFSTILLFLALLFFPPVLLAEITITAIDVGQGDAVDQRTNLTGPVPVFLLDKSRASLSS